MKAIIEKSVAFGKVAAPPSKSYAHRMLICSALANGTSTITGIAPSQDILATLDCLSTMGVKHTLKEDKATIHGSYKIYENQVLRYQCRQSGSTIRFFIPIALALGGVCEFYGSERLLSRGFDIYFDICNKQNIKYETFNDKIVFNGKLKPDNFFVRGDVSSQFITGLLFALPLLNKDSTITITTKLESAQYIDITLDVLKTFGIEIKRENNTFFIKGNQSYVPTDAVVEADASNAAFLDAFNYIGGKTCVEGVNKNTHQPDGIYKELFEMMNNGTPTIDISNCPDLGPILFALAGVKNGAHFTGTRRLKIKESDRANAMATELKKFEIVTDVYENDVIVHKSTPKKPNEVLFGYDDHRIVMALSIISTLFGAEIENAQAVAKSFPDFFDVLTSLQIKCKVTNNENN